MAVQVFPDIVNPKYNPPHPVISATYPAIAGIISVSQSPIAPANQHQKTHPVILIIPELIHGGMNT
jgi:hypothetical protein